MKLSDRAFLASYNQIGVFNEEHNVYFVQHKVTKDVYIKKTLTVYDIDIFTFVRDNHIRGMPCIVDFVEDRGTLTVIEEYISGKTLQSILKVGNRFSEKQATLLISQLCLIVQRLHNSEPVIIHRDIKPGNIIVTADEEVKLIDINAAKYFREGKNRDTRLIGTAGYAAPEQYGFAASGIQADIYAIGQVLREMVTWEETDRVSERLKAIIQKCTRMDPEDRYCNIQELLEDLYMFNKSIRDNSRGIFAEEVHSVNEVVKETARYNTKKSIRSFFLPGFRTGNLTHILVASLGYFFIFYFGFTLTLNNSTSCAELWIERISCIACCLITVFLSCNYCNLWHILKIDRIKNRFMKICKILICIAAAILVLMLIMSNVSDFLC